MTDAIEIDKVGSQIDVLPTLLNLFGIEYDSRLIVGKDILSDYIDMDSNEIKLETRLAEDLGLNSYEFMSVIGEIEEEFDVELDEREIVKLISIADLLDYISNFKEENVFA